MRDVGGKPCAAGDKPPVIPDAMQCAPVPPTVIPDAMQRETLRR